MFLLSSLYLFVCLYIYIYIFFSSPFPRNFFFVSPLASHFFYSLILFPPLSLYIYALSIPLYIWFTIILETPYLPFFRVNLYSVLVITRWKRSSSGTIIERDGLQLLEFLACGGCKAVLPGLREPFFPNLLRFYCCCFFFFLPSVLFDLEFSHRPLEEVEN